MQIFVGGQNELTLVTLLQNSAKITKNRHTEDILGKFGLQASSCIHFWLKTVSSCRKMQIFVGGQNELTLVTLLQNSAKITKNRHTEDILGKFGLQASSCIHFWLKTVSSCRKMQIFVGGQNELTLVTLLQNSAKITKNRHTEDILGKFGLQASSCIHFWLKTVSSCRKMQIFVGGQNELTLVTLLQNSAKITKIRQTEDILGKFGLQASSCIHFWLKTVSSCRKMQIFVGGQNELTLVTLLQNSAKITKNRHTEDILGKFGLQASSCIHFWLKTVSSCRKMQIFVGGQNELTLVTLLQNSAKITKIRQTEDILGKFGLQASSCIHFWLKTVSSCRKMQIFVGGQNELTLVTLLQNSAKITKNRHTEDILGKFGLQASSCIHFWLKTVSSCRKMQIFVGGQNELTLVTLLQNSAKITKIRHTEDILGKFGLQASSCIHFWLKTVSSCRKMQIFVGGQNELTLVTLLQNSAKITKNRQTEDILGKFGLQASSCIHFWLKRLKTVSSCRKMQLFVGGQNELTLVTLLQNSAKITKIRQTEDILGKFGLQASSCIHFWLKRLKTVSSCRKMQLFVGGQNELTLVTLLQNSAKITKIRQTEDILGKFGLQASSCIHFWLKTVSSCRKMQIFVGGQNELTLVTLLQNSAKITKNRHTEDILGKFGLQASSCIHFWLKTVSSCRKMQIFVGGQNELTLVTLLQNSAKITKNRHTEDILGKFGLQASSCIHFWLKTVSSCRKMQIFVGGQNELTLVTLLQNSAKITKIRQTEDILGKFGLQASSCIHFWLKTVSSCRKMQIFVGGQNELTLVTLLQNSAKITKNRHTEDILGKFGLQASSCIHFWLKTVSSCRKMQIFVGGQNELTLVTLLQNSAKITKNRHTEDILGKFGLQASSCIHFWLKTVSSCRKMQIFVGGQNELTLVTLLQNSAKITKNRHTEDILGKFGLQASSCIHFWLKTVSSCRKMQIFVGGQNELTLVTLLQNSAKITKIRQTEDILGKFGLQASSCIHFWLKTVSSCRKMQIFVGGQNELTLVTLLQNSAKITKNRHTEDILGKFGLQASSCIHFWLKTVSSCRKMQIFVGGQNELTLVTLLQNSAKITKIRQTEDILGKFGLQASSCIHFWLKTVSSCRKMQIFVGGQNELTLVTLLQNSAKITKNRHTEDILGKFGLQASSCIHFWLKTVSSCRKMQIFVGGQNELTLVTLLQNSAKITKIRHTEDILGKFGLQASSCIHFWLKTVSSCRKMQIFVGGQNELTLVTLLQNSAKITKIRHTEDILGKFGLQASSCIHFWLKRLKTVSSCRKMQIFVGGQNELTLVTLLQNSAKITKIRQTEDILGKFGLQASSCIHFWLKTVSSCRKMQIFVGGQNELTLVTLLQNSAKITKIRHTEDILGKFGLQASSCIHFWLKRLKTVSSCRKMQLFVGGQNELTLVTLLQNSAKITKIRQTEDILGKFGLQASSCIHFWLKTVSSCRKMQIFVGGQNELTLVTLLQNSAKITKNRHTEDILGKFGLQASSCIHFWLKTVSSCRKMQIFVGGQNELTLVTLLQNSAKITKIRHTEDILGKFGLQASSCIHFWLKTVSSCRKMQIFVGGQNELTLVTLLQNSAKITKIRQTEDILGKFGLQASSCIHFWLKTVSSCRKMQIFVGGQNELTLVTLLQNSAKITKIRQTEDILGKFGLQASSCIHFWLKTVSSCRKMQIFVGGQNELTLVTLLQNSAKITKIRHTEDILGKFALQASSCIHFWLKRLKTVSSCRKMQIFVGGQNELTLVTLLQNSAKITKIRHTEDILGKFGLQASSCIHFWLKTVSSCRKMQIFVGGQNELTLVTLLQNSAKITKNRHTEDILGKFGLQASSCIHFWLKTVSSCRKMQIFVGGQNELTLVTLLQNSAKITKIRHTEDILGKFGLQASSCIHFWLKTVSSCRKMQIFVGGQNELTLVTLLQNSAKITKIRQTEDILGKFGLQASSCIHFWLKTVSSCRKMQIFVGGQNELTLVTLLQNSAKITKIRQTEDILGKFGLQASSCIHFWLKTVSSCRKMQIFVGGQNELTLVTLLQNSAKITKIRHTEDILGKFALQASSCIHFWLKRLKTVSSCRKMQIFVGGQNELTLVTLLQNSAKITKIRQTEDILGKFALQASSCIHFWLKRLKTVSSCRKMQLFVGGQNELTLVTLLQNSAKITKIRHTEDILGKFGLQASSCIHFWLKTVSSCRKMQIFVGGQNELTLVTLLQNSAKITKNRQTEDILGKFGLQASSCILFG